MHIGKLYPYALFQRVWNADIPWPYLLGKFYRLHSNAFHFLNPIPIWDITVPVEFPDVPIRPGPIVLTSGPQTYPGHTIEFGWSMSLAEVNAGVYGHFYVTIDGAPAVDDQPVALAGFDGRGHTALWTVNSQIHFPGHAPGDVVQVNLTVRQWGDLPYPYP